MCVRALLSHLKPFSGFCDDRRHKGTGAGVGVIWAQVSYRYCVNVMIHSYSILNEMYCSDTCKVLDLNKPHSLSIFPESVLLISMYEFTYLTLRITFRPWKYDFWTGILLNHHSLHFSGEALIILIHLPFSVSLPFGHSAPCLSSWRTKICILCLSFCSDGVLFDSRCECSAYLVYCL